MVWLLIRIIGFLGGVVVVSGAVASATCWLYDFKSIDAAYEREVSANRAVAIGIPTDARLPIETRAIVVSTAICTYLDSIHWPFADGRMGRTVEAGAAHIDKADWFHQTFSPRMRRFMPVWYMRIETYGVVYLTCVGFIYLAYFIGQYSARKKIREGVHKRYVVAMAISWALRALLWVGVMATGWVACPAVIWWILPSLILSGVVIAVWRANMVELK
jgi:hypothetical protein